MIHLNDLLTATGGQQIGHSHPAQFSAFCYDSRRINPGELFIPVKSEGAWMDPGPLGTLGVGMPFGLAVGCSNFLPGIHFSILIGYTFAILLVYFMNRR